MKTLVVDDDFTNRLILQESLKAYGDVHLATNGEEAVQAARSALEEGEHYDLICLDIIMPVMDGHTALDAIRTMEEERGIMLGKGATVVMTTAQKDGENFIGAFREQCDHYIVKPIDISELDEFLRKADLIK